MNIVLYYGDNGVQEFYEPALTQDEEVEAKANIKLIMRWHGSTRWILYWKGIRSGEHDTAEAAMRSLSEQTGLRVAVSPHRVWQYPSDIPQEDADMILVGVNDEG